MSQAEAPATASEAGRELKTWPSVKSIVDRLRREAQRRNRAASTIEGLQQRLVENLALAGRGEQVPPLILYTRTGMPIRPPSSSEQSEVPYQAAQLFLGAIQTRGVSLSLRCSFAWAKAKAEDQAILQLEKDGPEIGHFFIRLPTISPKVEVQYQYLARRGSANDEWLHYRYPKTVALVVV